LPWITDGRLVEGGVSRIRKPACRPFRQYCIIKTLITTRKETLLGRPKKYHSDEERIAARRERDKERYAKLRPVRRKPGRPSPYTTDEERHEARKAKERERYAARKHDTTSGPKAAAILAFRAQGCANCGERDVCCIDAHHRNPDEKRGEVWRLWKSGTLEALMRELSVCVPLCANCHRKLHAGRFALPVL
jgi:hypothetical protein